MAPIDIEILADHSAQTPSNVGFIRVRRLELRTRFEDGTYSEPYRYDVADRDALDAVLMVLHAERENAPMDPYVCMRSALRPPLMLRASHPGVPLPDPRPGPVLWELPAGLIEPGGKGMRAVLETAARETAEEVGLELDPARFAPLGVPVYLSPGLMAEKLHFVHARVDRSRAGPVRAIESVEQGARVEWWPLSEALARASRGEVEDCKTELALRRLEALLAGREI